eukprot:TRINITY_DN68486_c0_g1_i1.p1 TRINITY_DN68486_c0_g1~~TRINITY_DN68486_c0_g1_i1.p1  ORF type:complete len:273 (+),score=19.52 TRINITY_DN68486_c0_g1_i1:116-934(+)
MQEMRNRKNPARRAGADPRNFKRDGPKPKIGVYGMHDGKMFPCTKVKIHLDIKKPNANITIDYTFRATFRDGELYFPISELGNIGSFKWILNGEQPVGMMEQAPIDGSEPMRYSLQQCDNPPTDVESIYYYYHKGESLKDMEDGQKLKFRIQYSSRIMKEAKGKYCWLLPLNILPRPPDEFTIDCQMTKPIKKIDTPNMKNHFLVTYNYKGEARNKASVIVVEPETIQLEHELFIVTIELGKAIKPQCADPVSLLVFFSFIGLIVFCSVFQK